MKSAPVSKIECVFAFSVIAIGIAIRILLALLSYGTNDVDTWFRFAQIIDIEGILQSYSEDPLLNHPPLISLVVWILYKIHITTSVPFSYLLKLPVILAEIASIWMIYKFCLTNGKRDAYLSASIYSLSLLSILLSGYHGNTDAVYTFFSLLTLFLLRIKSWKLAGAVFALAINIKLIPLIILPALILYSCTQGRLISFLSTFIACSLLLLSPLFIAGNAAVDNVFFYSSFRSYWGVQLFLGLIESALYDKSNWPIFISDSYSELGKIVVIAAVCLTLIAQRSVWDKLHLTTSMSYLLFAILAPGFAVQYLMLALALLAINPATRTHSILIGAFGGLYGLSSYLYFTVDTMPWRSIHTTSDPRLVVFFGFITWCVLLFALVSLIEKKKVSNSLASKEYSPPN